MSNRDYLTSRLLGFEALGDLSSHRFRAGDDFVEHSVQRPEFFANIVGDHPTADGIKCADAS